MMAFDKNVSPRMPPMSYAAILVHGLGMSLQLQQGLVGLSGQKNEAILQLIPVSVRPALLIIGAPGEDASSDRLVGKPSVAEQVHCRIVCYELQRRATRSPIGLSLEQF